MGTKANHKPVVAPMEDDLLIERCKASDPTAWTQLINRYYEVMYRIAYNHCRNNEDANDIVSRAMILLYKKISTFRAESSFTSWLYRIIRNVYVDVCVRDTERRNISLDDHLLTDSGKRHWEVADPSESPEELALTDERHRFLQREIGYLPQYQREVMAFHVKGKSHGEISSMTGLPIGTIKSRLNRARETLRRQLSMMEDVFVPPAQ